MLHVGGSMAGSARDRLPAVVCSVQCQGETHLLVVENNAINGRRRPGDAVVAAATFLTEHPHMLRGLLVTGRAGRLNLDRIIISMAVRTRDLTVLACQWETGLVVVEV